MAVKQNKDSGQSDVGHPTMDYDAGRMTDAIQTFHNSADTQWFDWCQPQT